MAHFYGTIDGKAQTTASRLGTVNSGLRVVAASWEGSVVTRLYERDGLDWAYVVLAPWQGAGVNKVLYDGPVSGQ